MVGSAASNPFNGHQIPFGHLRHIACCISENLTKSRLIKYTGCPDSNYNCNKIKYPQQDKFYDTTGYAVNLKIDTLQLKTNGAVTYHDVMSPFLDFQLQVRT